MANIRILDPNVVAPTVTNAQRILAPYGFSTNLDMDRYTLGPNQTTHDYVVGARELVPTNLKGSQTNWINLHTVYTHGYGFVAAEADQDVTNGKPQDYTEGEIPPIGPLGLNVPQVYFGQSMTGYAVVGAQGTAREYDGANQRTTYAGSGGVGLGSFLTRLAFAVHYKETSFLLNNTVSANGAKIIFNRDPQTMVQKVAPFLTTDGDPYPVVADGRIVWIVDAYTTMANYPYSERQSLSDLTGTSLAKGQPNKQINYIRNSVKATVDAYNGTVTLYQWDDNDPVLKAWERIFPGIVKPMQAMPASILAHVRYPQDLFDVQRSLLQTPPRRQPGAVLSTRRRSGTCRADPFNTGTQPPYYVLANTPLGTSTTPEFQLTSPMTVNSSPNLAAYISVDAIPVLTTGSSPCWCCRPSAIQGPTQVANVFKTQAKISEDITLLDTGQSRIIHGNLLTLPLGNSFLYVEPLYVESTYPTLQRVLVTYGDKIGYGATLQAALSDIQKGNPPGTTLNVGSTTTAPRPTTTTTPPPDDDCARPTVTGSGGLALTQPQAIAQLNQAFTDLQAAYRTGNFTTIGAAETKVQQLLSAYLAKYGSVPGATTCSHAVAQRDEMRARRRRTGQARRR